MRSVVQSTAQRKLLPRSNVQRSRFGQSGCFQLFRLPPVGSDTTAGGGGRAVRCGAPSRGCRSGGVAADRWRGRPREVGRSHGPAAAAPGAAGRRKDFSSLERSPSCFRFGGLSSSRAGKWFAVLPLAVVGGFFCGRGPISLYSAQHAGSLTELSTNEPRHQWTSSKGRRVGRAHPVALQRALVRLRRL